MNITELNIDCLEKVFKNLELNDLLNVADSNKYLKMIAEMVFASRYKRHFFKLFVGSETPFGLKYRNEIAKTKWPPYGSIPPYSVYNRLGHTDLECIEMHSLVDCFKVLRCFGHLIFKLSKAIHHFRASSSILDSNEDEVTIKEKQLARIASARVYTYVSKYCAGSLNEIVIDDCVKGNLNYLRKVFLNVEQVHIQGNRMKGDWLNRLFPKMQYLEIDFESVFKSINRWDRSAHSTFDFTSIANHYPNLIHLKLCPELTSGGEKFEQTFAQSYHLLRLNPQLQALEMPFIGHRQLLRAISDSLPHLQYLTFNSTYVHNLNYNGDRDMYHLKHVEKFVFRVNLHLQRLLPELHLTFDKLEELHFFNYSMLRSFNYQEQIFYSFVERHPFIKKFVTVLTGARDEEEIIQVILRIVEALPNLKQIGLGCRVLTHSCAAKIIERCEILKRYRFWCDPTEPYHHETDSKYDGISRVEWWFFTD